MDNEEQPLQVEISPLVANDNVTNDNVKNEISTKKKGSFIASTIINNRRQTMSRRNAFRSLHHHQSKDSLPKTFPAYLFQELPGDGGINVTIVELKREQLVQEIKRMNGDRRNSGLPKQYRKLDISLRDIHSLDPSLNLHGSSISVKKSAILINLDPVKAIVLSDRIYVLFSKDLGSNENGASRLVLLKAEKEHVDYFENLRDDLLNRLSDNFTFDEDLPFEVRAIDALLSSYCDEMNKKFVNLEADVKSLAEDFNSKRTKSGTRLESLRNTKTAVNQLELRLKDSISAFEEILDDADDLVLMQLSKLKSNPSTNLSDPYFQSDEIESTLDAYLQASEITMARVELLGREIQIIESIALMKLDAARNGLLRIEIFFTILTATAAVGSMYAGIFGMNLNNTLEDSHSAFLTVTLIVSVGSFTSTLLIFLYMYRKGLLFTE